MKPQTIVTDVTHNTARKVGFIGLGRMGAAMAESLRGHELGGSCKGKPFSLRASCLLFGGAVVEKPPLLPPNADDRECHENSQ